MDGQKDQPTKIPTLYEWAGKQEVIEELIVKFYDKVVEDDILKPIFQHMSKAHQIHVAHFISEVFGGPKLYTENGGSHFGMIKKHFQKTLTETHRKRWMELLLQPGMNLTFRTTRNSVRPLSDIWNGVPVWR